MISQEEHAKVESFYKSFGTQLHVACSCASLYTLTLNDVNESKATLDATINLFLSNDDNLISKQKWSVQHRGVPLWLFNTGVNPRRSFRQLKFTLAERGTGFILWQDRIDFRSDFKIFRKRKVSDSMQQQQQQKSSLYSLYQENIRETGAANNLIIAFKASDRKTLVFVKFDFYQEVLKFFNYFLKIHTRLNEEIRQRTKSLPNEKTIKPSNVCFIKYKRISKHDISLPSNIKHLINLKLNDRNIFYTLSKLLPSQ